MLPDHTQSAPLSTPVTSRDFPRSEKQDAWNEDANDRHQPIIGIPIPVQQGHQGPLLYADAVGTWAIERMRGRVFLIPLWPFPTHKHLYQSLWPLIQSMEIGRAHV